MSIKEKENELFNRWRNFYITEASPCKGEKLVKANEHANFVADGVADEEKFVRGKVGFVFVLKETNDWWDDDADLREMLNAGANGHGQTLGKIAKWVAPVFRTIDQDLANISDVDALGFIALIDLKKSTGGSRSVTQQIIDVTCRDAKYILEQAQLYVNSRKGATLFVCCGDGVGAAFNEHVVSKSKYSIKTICMRHPNARKAGGAEKFFELVMKEMTGCE